MNLKRYLESKGLTQDQAASELGVSKAYVSGVVTGNMPASLRLALEIEHWSKGEVPAESVCKPEDRYLLRRSRVAPVAETHAGAAA